jgi:hypothetical protein
MKLNKVVAIPALALAAGIGLAACGSHAGASVSHVAPTASHSVGPMSGNQPNLVKPTPTDTHVIPPQANHNPAHNPSGS